MNWIVLLMLFFLIVCVLFVVCSDQGRALKSDIRARTTLITTARI